MIQLAYLKEADMPEQLVGENDAKPPPDNSNVFSRWLCRVGNCFTENQVRSSGEKSTVDIDCVRRERSKFICSSTSSLF